LPTGLTSARPVLRRGKAVSSVGAMARSLRGEDVYRKLIIRATAAIAAVLRSTGGQRHRGPGGP
jgi:hypothetical protein